MNLSFILIEALTIVGVPAVIAVCLKHIVQDVRKERAKRDVELSNLRAEIEKQLRNSTEDRQKTLGEMERFTRRIKNVNFPRHDYLDAFTTRREFVVGYGGTRANPARSSKVRAFPKEWRQ